MYFWERIIPGLFIAAVCGIAAGIYHLLRWLL